MPGPPAGPSLRITTMSPARIPCSLTARKHSSSDSKTLAGPTCFLRSVPASLTTAPSGARLPWRIARPPSALSGSDSGRTTSCPSVSPPAPLGDGSLLLAFGRHHRRAAGDDPQPLEGTGHRVGGELASAGAGAGTDDALELVQFLVGHLAGGVGADRLEDVDDGHIAAVPAARSDRAAVEQDRRHVEPGQCHRTARDRLVASAEADDRIELVAAGHHLDRVGDHLAADH